MGESNRSEAVAAGEDYLLEERLADGIQGATACLLRQQAADGYWCGELEADTTLSSDYILYLHVLGDTARVPKLAEHIRRNQLSDGGWNIYEGGPAELNATVKAYLALKLAGESADAPHLVRARRGVHALRGLERNNSFPRCYLALVGAVGWELVLAALPELVILPSWFVLNLYRMSSWTRTIVVPLTIIYAVKPRSTHLPQVQVDE